MSLKSASDPQVTASNNCEELSKITCYDWPEALLFFFFFKFPFLKNNTKESTPPPPSAVIMDVFSPNDVECYLGIARKKETALCNHRKQEANHIKDTKMIPRILLPGCYCVQGIRKTTVSVQSVNPWLSLTIWNMDMIRNLNTNIKFTLLADQFWNLIDWHSDTKQRLMRGKTWEGAEHLTSVSRFYPPSPLVHFTKCNFFHVFYIVTNCRNGSFCIIEEYENHSTYPYPSHNNPPPVPISYSSDFKKK